MTGNPGRNILRSLSGMIAKHRVSVLAICASCWGLTVPVHLCTIERRNVGGVQCCGKREKTDSRKTDSRKDRRVIASWYDAGVRLRPAMDPPLITASIKRCRKLDVLLQLHTQHSFNHIHLAAFWSSLATLPASELSRMDAASEAGILEPILAETIKALPRLAARQLSSITHALVKAQSRSTRAGRRRRPPSQ